MPAEQPTDMFCRSNRQGTSFVMLLFCGGCCFILAVMLLKKSALPVHGEIIAHARSAWYETCQQHKRLVLASCVILSFYSNSLLLACTVVADHLRFHVVDRRVPLELQLVAVSRLWFYFSAARFHDRHVTQKSMRMAHPITVTSAKKSRIRMRASWKLEGSHVVVCSVRSDLSVGSRKIQH
eukprot:6490487-Amphidinium_carterae.1